MNLQLIVYESMSPRQWVTLSEHVPVHHSIWLLAKKYFTSDEIPTAYKQCVSRALPHEHPLAKAIDRHLHEQYMKIICKGFRQWQIFVHGVRRVEPIRITPLFCVCNCWNTLALIKRLDGGPCSVCNTGTDSPMIIVFPGDE